MTRFTNWFSLIFISTVLAIFSGNIQAKKSSSGGAKKSAKKHHKSMVSKQGMSASWTFQGNYLVVSLQAPTTGWVVVGFNNQDGLQNARLFFVKIEKGKGVAEEHRTDFPSCQ